MRQIDELHDTADDKNADPRVATNDIDNVNDTNNIIDADNGAADNAYNDATDTDDDNDSTDDAANIVDDDVNDTGYADNAHSNSDDTDNNTGVDNETSNTGVYDGTDSNTGVDNDTSASNTHDIAQRIHLMEQKLDAGYGTRISTANIPRDRGMQTSQGFRKHVRDLKPFFDRDKERCERLNDARTNNNRNTSCATTLTQVTNMSHDMDLRDYANSFATLHCKLGVKPTSNPFNNDFVCTILTQYRASKGVKKFGQKGIDSLIVK